MIEVNETEMKAAFWEELENIFFGGNYDEDEFSILFASQHETVKNLRKFGKGDRKDVPAD